MAEKLLDLQGVSMSFGGLRVVDGLDLHVDRGEIVSVIGPNGGRQDDAVQPRHGRVSARPTAISSSRVEHHGPRAASDHAPRDRADVPDAAVFLNMSVRENVMAAAYGHTKAGVFRSMLRTPGMRREEQEIRELAEKRLAFFGERLMGSLGPAGLQPLLRQSARRSRARPATKPTMLLLDEPAAGMNPKETQEITELIASSHRTGATRSS